MLADLHVHTEHSHDSWAEVGDILDTAERRGLEVVAITDHDTVTGAQKACNLAANRDIRVIPGVERTVPAGEHGVHLIGLNVDQLPPNNDAVSVVDSIHNQGGTVVVPHPFRIGTGLLYHAENGTVPQSAAESVLQRASLIEICNWKDSQAAISKTLEFARNSSHGIVAGTDAHTTADIGKISTRIESPEAIEQESEVIVQVEDPATISLDNLPERLLGRSPRSKDSALRTKLVSLTANLMDLIPGDEPNYTTKRIVQRVRATLEGTSTGGPVDDAGSSSVVISRSDDGIDLRATPTNSA